MIRLFRAPSVMIARRLHLNMLPQGPRNFLAFNFLNILSWSSILSPVLVLHANALGISSTAIGALNSILYFACILGIFTKSLAERIGSKRLLLGGWTLRNLLAAPIVLIPLVRYYFGFLPAATLLFTCITLFCITRAMANIAWGSWLHEIIPPHSLGRYYTVDAIMTRVLLVVCGLACFLAFGGVSSGQNPDGPNYGELWRFAGLAAFGVAAGLFSTRVLRNVPGGMPPPPDPNGGVHHASFGSVMRDRMFIAFLFSSAFFSCIYVGTGVFLPLLLKKHFGLSTGMVLLLTSIGNLLAVFTTPRWRRMADRHGSPATMLANGLLLSSCLAVLGALAYMHPSRPPVYILLPVCALIPVAESGNSMACSRGYMLRITAANRHACNAVWNAGTQTICGIVSILVGFMLRESPDGMDLRFACVAWGAAVLIAGAGWFALRIPIPDGDAQPGPSPVYDPAHPLLSIYRVIPYILNPRASDSLLSETVDRIRK